MVLNKKHRLLFRNKLSLKKAAAATVLFYVCVCVLLFFVGEV